MAASALILGLASGKAQTPAPPAGPAPDCDAVGPRFDAMLDRYFAAGVKAIENADPGPAMERARKAALAGDAEATVTMIGIGMVLRGRPSGFSIPMVRQACTYAERNRLGLHVVACAYANMLNPLGDRAEKLKATEAAIARYEQQGSESALPRPEAADMALLKACLPQL